MKNKIILANSDAYNAANLSEPLSAYCAGLPIDDGAAELLAFIAPEVKTARRFEYNKFGDGILLADEDDERAVRGEFKEIDISGDVVNAKLVNHGLTLAIDDDEFFADYEQEVVRILKNRLVANELSRAVAMAKAAAGTLESKTWKSGGGTNPDLDIRKLITSVGDKGGINANRVLVGDAAWTYRLESLLGSQNTASGGQAMFTIDNLRGFVGAEKILTCDKRFETKVKDSDGKAAKEYKAFLANYVLAFNARDGISKFDPSTFKRFVGEEGFQVYVEKKTKRTIVTVEHYSLLAQTGVGACKGLSVSNS